jgi:hypothetical protein
MKISTLKQEDYNPYYSTYIANLKDDTLLEALEKDLESFQQFISSITANKLVSTYAKDKWTIAEVLVHITDTERVFQYRALCIARNDKSSFPGFEQDDYVANANSNNRSKESLLNEFIAVRKSSIVLFTSLSDNALQKRGEASNSALSVAAAGFIIGGHLRHHKKIVEERYL